jgi:hypothetical protein
VQQALECFKKSPEAVELKIHDFRIHLESLHVHQEAKIRLDAERQTTTR